MDSSCLFPPPSFYFCRPCDYTELVYRERKERESILTSYKKQAEERKAQAERVERRVSDIGTAHSALP